MVSFNGIVQIAVYTGPFLLPRAIAFYRSLRSAPRSSIRDSPPAVRRCLNVLLAAVVVSSLLSMPYFAPSNFFKDTNSRLALPTNLLASRLNALRQGNFTELDTIFLDKLEHEPEKFRLMYAAYGPDVALRCPFCQANEPSSYLYYYLTALAIPHLMHIVLLGIVTSSFFSGPEGSRWRTHATVAGVALALAEGYLTWNYNWETNGSRRLLADVDFFYWRMRIWRHLSFAIIDALFGWTLWLTSTKRWLVISPTTTEQLVHVTRDASIAHAQMNLLGNLRNAIVRDNGLRETQDSYWRQEQVEMEGIMHDDGVRSAMNVVLSREEYDQTRRRAQLYVESVLDATMKSPNEAGKKEQ